MKPHITKAGIKLCIAPCRGAAPVAFGFTYQQLWGNYTLALRLKEKNAAKRIDPGLSF